MKPISEQQLQNRLGSGSKSRLKQFRSALRADRDCRNYDSELDKVVSKYIRNPKDYRVTKDYLRNLKSSKDGKFYSQGVKSYSQVVEAVSKFAEPNYTSLRWNRNYQRAKDDLTEIFRNLKLKMLSYDSDESIVTSLPKLDTHSGFTFLETGKKEKRDNVGDIYNLYQKAEMEALRSGSFNKPILPATRTQGSGAFNGDGEWTNDCKHKTRLVSMIDIMVIIAELKFAKPIQTAMAEMPWYAGGKDPNAVSVIITNMRYRHRYFMSLDYSSFDQTISDWLIEDAFDIIGSSFTDLDEKLFSVIKEDFIHKNFVTADGVVYSRKGVPSGSMFTQIIDSVVNYLMVSTFMASRNLNASMIIMGDDNLVYTDERVMSEDIASYLRKNFGVIVNPDKSTYGWGGKDPNFLSRVWRSDGQWREPHEVISKMLYPERWRDYRMDEATPEMVLYAYILTYNITMAKLINVDQFLVDNPSLSKVKVMDIVDSRYLPGALAFIREYTKCA